ncbi:hypothetical protein DMUE_0312 [Dictyocoela muelleri]|nr:hypothetical protein DMUE_0312 [Dictyocoela muelleri]
MLFLPSISFIFQLHAYLGVMNAASARGEDQNIPEFNISLDNENYYHHACVFFQQKLIKFGVTDIKPTEKKFIDEGMILKLRNLTYIFDHNLNCEITKIPNEKRVEFGNIYFYPAIEIRSKHLMKISLNDEIIKNLFCSELDLVRNKSNNGVKFIKKKSPYDDIKSRIPVFSNLKKLFRTYDHIYPRLSSRDFIDLTMDEYQFSKFTSKDLERYVTRGYCGEHENEYSSQTDIPDQFSEEFSSKLNIDENKGAKPKKRAEKPKKKNENTANPLSTHEAFTRGRSSLFPEESEIRYKEEPLFPSDDEISLNTYERDEFPVIPQKSSYLISDNPDIPIDQLETGKFSKAISYDSARNTDDEQLNRDSNENFDKDTSDLTIGCRLKSVLTGLKSEKSLEEESKNEIPKETRFKINLYLDRLGSNLAAKKQKGSEFIMILGCFKSLSDVLFRCQEMSLNFAKENLSDADLYIHIVESVKHDAEKRLWNIFNILQIIDKQIQDWRVDKSPEFLEEYNVSVQDFRRVTCNLIEMVNDGRKQPISFKFFQSNVLFLFRRLKMILFDIPFDRYYIGSDTLIN